MILLNFGHAITPGQRRDLMGLLGNQQALREETLGVHFDLNQPFEPQVCELFGRISFSTEELESSRVVLILPDLSVIAAALLAEFHGRVGRFPEVVLRRPAREEPYEVAGLVNLQRLREEARAERGY